MKTPLLILCAFLFLMSCGGTEVTEFTTQELHKIVEQNASALNEDIKRYTFETSINHSKLAAEQGEYTPPSLVTIFSDDKINAELLQKNQLIGVDLPFKILFYSEPDTSRVYLAYTSADFIKRRHNLADEDLKKFRQKIDKIVGKFPQEMYAPSHDKDMNFEFGIVKIKSNKDFENTIKALKEAVGGEGDTQFFRDIDFQARAKAVGIDINPTYLILFGAPAPGAKAMYTTPRLGLDAFCQKLLVFQDKNGEVFIAFNDIEDLSELYYKKWTVPQMVINYRLSSTLGGAVE